MEFRLQRRRDGLACNEWNSNYVQITRQKVGDVLTTLFCLVLALITPD